MSISTPFIRRPVATSLLMAAFVLVGIAAYPLLPVAPLPRVDFPTISVNAKFPGASPETMASTGCPAAGIPVRADRRRRSAHVGQRAGTSGDHHPVRPRPQHRRRRGRRAGGDQRRHRAVAEEPSVAADLSQGQSVRLADHDPGGAVRRGAADRGRRLCRQHPVAADLADLRRVAGVHRRRAEARGARAGRPGDAWRRWASRWRTCAAH